MKEYFQKAKEYVIDHKKEFIIGGSIAGAVIIILFLLALYSYNHRQPSIVYEPANACDLLTLDEAKTLLGDKTINGVVTTPVQQGNLTISKCSYSDGLSDTANAVVAAIIVRSGVNDAGILQNKNEFVAGKPSAGVEDVTGVGDSAYFNTGLGQLNVLKDSTWILVSYGSGASPQGNSLDDTVKLAKLVLNAQ
ncbi:MAG TPA: hypothetical protein VIM31_00450 [Candidatus Microsaccharimonas sp.]|jgi:hypothetical protein